MSFSNKTSSRAKLVIVGDGGCGKTSALHVFSHGHFLDTYVPTVYDSTVEDIEVGGRTVELVLNDTAGQEDFGDLRILSYKGADVILVCFAVDSRTNLLNVTEKWMKEVRLNAPDVPVILVGTKKDVRQDNFLMPAVVSSNGEQLIKASEGEETAQAIGARLYLECSAKVNSGICELFYEAAKLALQTVSSKSARRKPSRRLVRNGNVNNYRGCAIL